MAERAAAKPIANSDLLGVTEPAPTIELDLRQFALPTSEEIAANGGSVNPGEFRTSLPQLKSDEPVTDADDKANIEDWGGRYGEDGLYGKGGEKGPYDVEEVTNIFGDPVIDDGDDPYKKD